VTHSPTKHRDPVIIPEQYLKQLDKASRYSPQHQRQRVQNHLRQLELISQCDDALQQQATTKEEAPPQYDIIMRVREDVAFETPFDASVLLPLLTTTTTTATTSSASSSYNKHHTTNATILTSDCKTWGAMNDRFAVVVAPYSDFASSYFRAPYERFVNPCETFVGIYNTETFLLDTFLKLNATVIATPAIPSIVKYTENPDGGDLLESKSEQDRTCPAIRISRRIDQINHGNKYKRALGMLNDKNKGTVAAHCSTTGK